MPPLIRSLDPVTDRAAVDEFFRASADYVWLERDQLPGPDLSQEFFNDAPPGADPAASVRVGLFDRDLIGIAELSFGFPDPCSAYLGLMMIAPQARGQGMGKILLHHLEKAAQNRGATTLYLAVLEANPRGRDFWYGQGFALALANRPVTLGAKTQVTHRLYKLL